MVLDHTIGTGLVSWIKGSGTPGGVFLRLIAASAVTLFVMGYVNQTTIVLACSYKGLKAYWSDLTWKGRVAMVVSLLLRSSGLLVISVLLYILLSHVR
ncbi:MAG: hypothetical protein KIS87_08135 [Phycisphaeraceae bacterium]|nr:hypothetical protein [Phycisphaeraceae bacterium]